MATSRLDTATGALQTVKPIDLVYPIGYIYRNGVHIIVDPNDFPFYIPLQARVWRSFTNLLPENFEDPDWAMTEKEIITFFKKTGTIVTVVRCKVCDKVYDSELNHGCKGS